MYLSKLTLRGFKSFADYTEICFAQGITGLVGPNGCGKSNVVDAIRWALGDMRARTLRGDEMLDVVFNGTENRPPLGYAEVSLHFVNDDHKLPIEYDEVVVTRRLFRSGESEYMLNKQACRLKDIKDLFLDTGIGPDSYSIIEQGRIDAILQASPRDRREFFEEAAGISKYRARKRETETKLEHVTQDLLRLGDMIKEFTTQCRSLKIQASKAQKYRQIVEDIRNKKLLLAFHVYEELNRTKAALAEELQKLQARQLELKTQSETVQSGIAELESRKERTEDSLNEAGTVLNGLQSASKTLEFDLETRRNSLTQLGEERTRIEQEIEGIRSRLASLDARTAETLKSIEKTSTAMDQLTATITDKQATLEELSRAATTTAEALSRKKGEAMDALQKRSTYQNQLTGVMTEKKVFQARLEKIVARHADIIAETDKLKQEMGGVETQIRTNAQEAEAKQQTAKQVETEREALAQDLAALRKKISTFEENLGKKDSHRLLLADMERQLEGRNEATKAVINEINTESCSLKGILGTLPDLIQMDAKYGVAIEAALPDATDTFITKTLQDAISMLQFGEQAGHGRLHAVALNSVGLPQGTPPAEPATGLIPAADIVTCDPEVRPAVASLLSGVFLAESLVQALAAVDGNARDFTVVTLDGYVLSPTGQMSAGRAAAQQNVISRRAELKQLEKETSELATRLSSLKAEEGRTAAIVETKEREAKELRMAVYELKAAGLELKGNLDNLGKRVQMYTDEQKVSQIEQTETEARIASANEKEAALGKLITECQALYDAINFDAERLAKELAQIAAQRDAINDLLTELKVALSGLREKREALNKELAQIDAAVKEANKGLERATTRLGQITQQTETTRQEITDLTAKAEETNRKLEEHNAVMTRLRKEIEEIAPALTESRTRLQAIQKELDELQPGIQEARFHESEANLKLENIVQRARDEQYADNLPEQFAAWKDDGQTNWDQLVIDIDELVKKVHSIGDINLAAIEQLKEAEEKLNFYTTQQTDLVQSKESLEELIRKLNRESREMFTSTLDQVRRNFNQVFRKLFGGGKTDIILEENVDILDAGIDVMAKPPGKEFTSITLLSGGERALTTFALVMSIFMLKPSPFCLMDEVDAPLDESNVDRFVALVQEYAANTQFILITHNKRTMASANVLFGVVMEEQGVSKKVSIKLVEEEVAVCAEA